MQGNTVQQIDVAPSNGAPTVAEWITYQWDGQGRGSTLNTFGNSVARYANFGSSAATAPNGDTIRTVKPD
jgi:hypothetical protein